MRAILITIVLCIGFWVWLLSFAYHKGYETGYKVAKIEEWSISEETQAKTRAKILHDYQIKD
jgi:hypothetical protein